MYAGNLPEATKALNDYARLRPEDPNALDSLGEANFYLGQFAAAEKFFRQSYDKDPHFADGIELTKAAYARLMIGDIKGADAIFNQYLDTRRKDPMADFRRAEWEFASGRRRQAVARMETFVRSLPAAFAAIAPQLYAQLTVWNLELGDQAHAREFGLKAASQGAVSVPALIARLLIEPAAPASEWTARAAQLLPGPEKERLRKIVLAYALVLHKEFQAAEPILSDLYQHSVPEPQEILPVLLAWTKVETGHFDQAAPLAERNPIPSTSGDIFMSLAYPRLFYLRGAILEKQGHRDEAAKNYRLFLTLSGPDALVFGEEAKARKAL
jgi:tetratricopeptide (TPR) repeat protein